MRTTITIDEGLLDQIRRRAAALRTTISQVIEDSVRESLARHPDGEEVTFRITPFRGGGVQRGVDLDDNAALLALMDDE